MATQRDAALDNLKGLLIISVVYVHFYDLLGQKTALLFTIRTLLLTVQMPLFLFLSGYFGKHVEKRRRSAWADYLIPFLLFNPLYYLIRSGQEDIKFGLLRPLNMYWFLLTLLVIRLLMPELLRVRWLLPVSIVVALLAGGDKDFGRVLSLSRTVCFLPFYLMGYYCTPEHMKRIRKIPIPVAAAGAAAGALMALWLTDTMPLDKEASHPFQLVNSYATQGLEPWQGIAFRLAIYIAAPLMGMLLIRLIPSRRSLLTGIGRGSMTVYLLHAFPMLWVVEYWETLCQWFNRLFPMLEGIAYPGRLCYGIPQVILLGIYAFLVSWILSSPPVVRSYNRLIAGAQRMVFYPEKTGKSEQQMESVQEIR